MYSYYKSCYNNSFLSKACGLVFNATSQEKSLLIIGAKEEYRI